MKGDEPPWLVWLSGLSASLQTTRSPVRFPVRAHAWVAGQVPSWGHAGKTQPINVSLPLFLLSKNKYIQLYLNNNKKMWWKKKKGDEPYRQKEQIKEEEIEKGILRTLVMFEGLEWREQEKVWIQIVKLERGQPCKTLEVMFISWDFIQRAVRNH